MSLITMSALLLNASGDGDSITSLGSLFQCLTTLSVKKIFLMIYLSTTFVFFVLLLVTWEKRLASTSLHHPFRQLQGVIRVPPERHLLWAQDPRLPHPVLSGLVFQTLHQLHCPSLDTLQYFSVLHQSKCVCLHSQGFMFLGKIPSVVWCASPSPWQRLVTFLQLVCPSASTMLLCPMQQWVAKGRILPHGFQVGDSFDVRALLEDDFESH